MNARTLTMVSLSLLIAACARDPDGDGLTNGEERDLGLDRKLADTDGDGLSDGDEVTYGADPLNQDTDGDGLLDGEEIENGADPTVVDTDGDSYTDRDEVFEGHDPADERDRIYKGRWPYYFEKDELTGGAVNGTRETGKRFAHLVLKDQFNDDVDLFDFYNSDKPVVIDVSTQWCPPCNALALWLDGGPDTTGFASSTWPAGPEVIARGDVYWITILTQDMTGAPATRQTAKEWYDEYPNKDIPILADGSAGECGYGSDSECYIDLTFWPSGVLLKNTLKVDGDSPDSNSMDQVLAALNEMFPE